MSAPKPFPTPIHYDQTGKGNDLRFKRPPRICCNCGDPANAILRLGDRAYPKCGACFDIAYEPRWEAAAIKY